MPDNCFVESFNRRLRDECLNEHLLRSYRLAREIIEDWRIDNNLHQPRTSLDGLTSNEFATRSAVSATPGKSPSRAVQNRVPRQYVNRANL